MEEMVSHVENNTSQAITQQMMYYQKKGYTDVVVKIKKARIFIKQQKLMAELDAA